MKNLENLKDNILEEMANLNEMGRAISVDPTVECLSSEDATATLREFSIKLMVLEVLMGLINSEGK